MRSLEGDTTSLALTAASGGTYTGRVTLAPGQKPSRCARAARWAVDVPAARGRHTGCRHAAGRESLGTSQPAQPAPAGPSAPVTPGAPRRSAPAHARWRAFTPAARLVIHGRVARAVGSLGVDEPVTLQSDGRRARRRGSRAGGQHACRHSQRQAADEHRRASLSGRWGAEPRILLPLAELARTGTDVIVDATAADGQRSSLRIHFRR